MDQDDQIRPQGYSAVLGWMILAFIVVILAATISQVI
jgi:hypothetical protein